MKLRIVLYPLVAFGLFACSSSDSTKAVAADAGTVEDGAASSSDTGAPTKDSGTATNANASKPATPQLLGVAKLGGGLHVTWKLNDTGLTGMELWRKKDAGTYAKATGLPGTATSYHDTPGAGATYCYQVMSLKGGEMSDMSNELCGTP